MTDFSQGATNPQTATLPMPYVSTPVQQVTSPLTAPLAAIGSVAIQANNAAIGAVTTTFNTVGAAAQQAENAIGGGIQYLQGLL